jgi:SAM-dependent methyltransferase
MWEARARSFEHIAATYDEFRPGYPEALYERIVAYGGLSSAARALEVGVGTGKATLPFARRGFRIRGLEPGAPLAAIARANLAGFPGVDITTTSFEDWAVEPAAFELAFTAQAFHWLDERRRLPKFAEALQKHGVLAVFGNVPTLPEGALRSELDEVYRRQAPALSQTRQAHRLYASADDPFMAEMRASPDFADVEFDLFHWQRELDAASYCTLVSTYSDHATMDPARRAALLSAIGDTIGRHGGALTLHYQTGLLLARRV